MKPESKDWKSLAIAIGLAQAAGLVGGAATASSVRKWYPTLRKPSWNPPSWVFGPVWTALYLLMGIASWLVWRAERPEAEKQPALQFYGTQLGLNTLWSVIFFGFRQVGLAAGEIGLLWAAILGTIVRFFRIRPLAGLLLVPYLLWTTFAGVLNATVWQLNRKE